MIRSLPPLLMGYLSFACRFPLAVIHGDSKDTCAAYEQKGKPQPQIAVIAGCGSCGLGLHIESTGSFTIGNITVMMVLPALTL